MLDRQKIQYEQLKHKASGYLQKSETPSREPSPATVMPAGTVEEFTEAEVELELLRLKDNLKGGVAV